MEYCWNDTYRSSQPSALVIFSSRRHRAVASLFGAPRCTFVVAVPVFGASRCTVVVVLEVVVRERERRESLERLEACGFRRIRGFLAKFLGDGWIELAIEGNFYQEAQERVSSRCALTCRPCRTASWRMLPEFGGTPTYASGPGGYGDREADEDLLEAMDDYEPRGYTDRLRAPIHEPVILHARELVGEEIVDV